jgi:hypothetical protein
MVVPTPGVESISIVPPVCVTIPCREEAGQLLDRPVAEPDSAGA